MAQESRVNGSQLRKLIFSYGYLFGGVMGILFFSTPSHSNLLFEIDLTDDCAQSTAQGGASEGGLELAVQPTGRGDVYDSDAAPSDEPGLFGRRARYAYPLKTGGLTLVHPTGFGDGVGPFSADGSNGDDGNDGNEGNDAKDGEDPFGNIIVPEDVVQDSVADASDLLMEVNFKNYRYGRLLKSL